MILKLAVPPAAKPPPVKVTVHVEVVPPAKDGVQETPEILVNVPGELMLVNPEGKVSLIVAVVPVEPSPLFVILKL